MASSEKHAGQVTRWLGRLRDGDAAALDELVPLVYDDLRMIARKQLRGERPDMRDAMTAFMKEHHPWIRNSHAYGEPGGSLGLLGGALHGVAEVEHRQQHLVGIGEQFVVDADQEFARPETLH